MKKSQVVLLHGVARLVLGQRLFESKDGELAWLAWAMLRREFPDALAMVLMPNHIHILLESTQSRFAKRLNRLTRVLSRRFAGIEWEECPAPRIISDVQHLARQVRYVHLNPCRKNLQKDPLSWPWSTHRELCGLTLYRSSGLRRLNALVKPPTRGWHHYISADPSVQVAGTQCPEILPLNSLSADAGILRGPSHFQWESLARSLFGFRACNQVRREARALAAVFARKEKCLGSKTPRYSTVYRLSRQFRRRFSAKDLDLLLLSATDPRLRSGALHCPVDLLCRKRRVKKVRTPTST